MPGRILKLMVGLLAAVAVGAGLFALGWASAGGSGDHGSGYRQGHVDGYLAGLRVGTAQGREEGRADQEVARLPAAARAAARQAFADGYAAGAGDVFAGYDGGWGYATPYVITLERGSGSITYRIAGRTPLQPGTAYYLCPDGHSVCQQPR